MARQLTAMEQFAARVFERRGFDFELRPAVNDDDRRQRNELVARARRIRNEIAQYTEDCRAAGYDGDPDGLVQRLADGLDRMLAGEAYG